MFHNIYSDEKILSAYLTHNLRNAVRIIPLKGKSRKL